MKLDGLKGFGVPPLNTPIFRLNNARLILESAFREILAENGVQFQWIDEYDEIVDWLTDNKGQGLFLCGVSGRGKSLLVERVLPFIFNQYHRKIVRVYQASDINEKIDEIKQKKLITVDDLGTEGNYNKYGATREPVYELLDSAERHGKILLISSNLSGKDFVEKYDWRCVERLRAVCRIISFKGNSLRRK